MISLLRLALYCYAISIVAGQGTEDLFGGSGDGGDCQCINGGVCQIDGTCDCPEEFGGSQCQIPRKTFIRPSRWDVLHELW
ncbi:urokinase-type plasminogen activator-like isoform X2 [Lytechinus variegatus]|uniref:urokinase-type plasminogen activator-like isoform X2 n=1 Tax=Lytechinus variegatus TaxID=7654 RepID=UPI001BB116AE|nr:urokinase-type plasminogen activator-like isoform X2 [Lytechinus variegatus]